jgi:hypothetical protein
VVLDSASVEKKFMGKVPQCCVLQPLPTYLSEADTLMHVAQRMEPVFDQRTEDGSRFRIYRLGYLELRSVQNHDEGERLGAVFSVVRATPPEGARAPADIQEKIASVTEYVERTPSGARRSYVVLHTEQGKQATMEKLADGTVFWQDGPADLAGRNALAKVVAHAECRAGTTVGDMKAYQPVAGAGGARSASRRYAQGAYFLALHGAPITQKGTAAKSSVGFRSNASRRCYISGAGGWARACPVKNDAAAKSSRQDKKHSQGQYRELGDMMLTLMGR